MPGLAVRTLPASACGGTPAVFFILHITAKQTLAEFEQSGFEVRLK